jgi:hypothetical protein
VDIPRVKRHSTPITTGYRPSCASILDPITEFETTEHHQEGATALVTTPYQPLVEEDLSSVRTREEEEEEEEEEVGAVIANLNARSPSPNGAGSPIPRQKWGFKPHPLNLSQETDRALSPGSPTLNQEDKRRRGRSVGGRLLPSSSGTDNQTEGGKRKRSLFHKRSDSDSNPSTIDREADMGAASTRSSSSLGMHEKRRSFRIRRSSSEGNIHLMFGAFPSSTPDTGPDPVSVTDNETVVVPFRRVTTIASPLGHDSGPAGILDGCGAPTYRPLRRSLTVDSPEPMATGEF